MLSQSVLAMYSLLNMMKSVVASQNIFLGSSEVYTGTTKTELLIIGSFSMAPMHKLQYFGKAVTTKISNRLLYGYARARTPGNSFDWTSTWSCIFFPSDTITFRVTCCLRGW